MFHVARCDSILKHESLHEIQLSVQEFLSSFVLGEISLGTSS